MLSLLRKGTRGRHVQNSKCKFDNSKLYIYEEFSWSAVSTKVPFVQKHLACKTHYLGSRLKANDVTFIVTVAFDIEGKMLYLI